MTIGFRGRVREMPLTRQDCERGRTQLLDPTLESTYVNVCRCRQPPGPFTEYKEAGVGWAVTYFDGVLTVRCHACHTPIYYFALQ
jgi:hypothetical protein